VLILSIKFLLGAALLVLGAEWLVRGASLIARRFNIPAHVIGLTLVALGTSAPELFVNVLAAWNGKTDFALANVSGSNLANLCVGFGLCALLAKAHIRRRDFSSDTVLLCVTPLLVLGMMYAQADRSLPWLAVVPLTAILAYYLRTLKGRTSDDELSESALTTGIGWGIGQFVAGVASLYFGGEIVLKSAMAVAQELHVGADVIALTIVAFGTSIPDITASVVAARRGEHGIAAGNILGSNISNVALVLNASLLANAGPLKSSGPVRMDYLVVVLVSLLVCGLVYRLDCVPKKCGWFLIFVYVGYLTLRLL
jgi:cation:H+ antiporter